MKRNPEYKTMDLSYNRDVAKQIDDSRFTQQFYVNTRGLYNQGVNPFARQYMKNEPVSYRNHIPAASNHVDQVIHSTDCCTRPGQTVVVGRKSEDAPLENATYFWKEVQTAPHKNRRTGTTTRIEFNQTEN